MSKDTVLSEEELDDAVYWAGRPPRCCDICKTLFGGGHHDKDHEIFVDGRMRDGRWAIMCLTCHIKVGVGLGIGKGQMYLLQSDGRYQQMAGGMSTPATMSPLDAVSVQDKILADIQMMKSVVRPFVRFTYRYGSDGEEARNLEFEAEIYAVLSRYGFKPFNAAPSEGGVTYTTLFDKG